MIGNGAGEASISANGRFVAFAASATPSRAHGDLGRTDVLVRDLRTNTNTLVSRATGANGAKGNADPTLRPSQQTDGVSPSNRTPPT